MVVILKKTKDRSISKYLEFSQRNFLRIPPLQIDRVKNRKNTPPSKPQKRFEGGVFLVIPPGLNTLTSENTQHFSIHLKQVQNVVGVNSTF